MSAVQLASGHPCQRMHNTVTIVCLLLALIYQLCTAQLLAIHLSAVQVYAVIAKVGKLWSSLCQTCM